MTKTTKITLWVIVSLVIGILNLIFLGSIVSFAFLIGCTTSDNPPLSFTEGEVESIGNERCRLSGMTFPEDMTYMNGEYGSLHGRYGVWFYSGAWNYISTEPFKLPEKMDHKVDNRILVGEEEINNYERWFSEYFKTKVRGAAVNWSGTWITNGFVFEASILKTHEKYYLHLYSHDIETRHLERHLECAENLEEVRAAQEMLKEFVRGDLKATCEAAVSIAEIVWWKYPIDFSLEMLDEVDKILKEKEDKSLINKKKKEPVTDYYRAQIYYTIGEVEKGDEYAEKAQPRIKEESVKYLQYLRTIGVGRQSENLKKQRKLLRENIEEQSKGENP
ncbi:MAG: hypothetical protein IJU47_09145 [Verrucomicrobia bacterium]|nr:hypothetical protein [Verrucomicrobiota bacterium]